MSEHGNRLMTWQIKCWQHVTHPNPKAWPHRGFQFFNSLIPFHACLMLHGPTPQNTSGYCLCCHFRVRFLRSFKYQETIDPLPMVTFTLCDYKDRVSGYSPLFCRSLMKAGVCYIRLYGLLSDYQALVTSFDWQLSVPSNLSCSCVQLGIQTFVQLCPLCSHSWETEPKLTESHAT